MQSEGPVQLRQVSRWRSATRVDDLNQKQVMQYEGPVQLRQVSQWRSATRVDDLSQNHVMQPGNQFNSYKSVDGDQQLPLTTLVKSRSRSLRGPVQLRQVSRWRSATRVDDLSQKHVIQPGNQFNSGRSADGDQPLALTTSAKSRSCSLRDQFNSGKSAHGA